MPSFRNICLISSLFILQFFSQAQSHGYDYYFMEQYYCSPGRTEVHLGGNVSLYGFVRQTVDSSGYSMNKSCSLVLIAPENFHIILRFRRVETYKPGSECDTDYVTTRGNTTTHVFCGHGVPSAAYVSTGRFLEINFTSGNWDTNGENDRLGFDLYFTAYHDGVCNEDDNREFKCWNHHCIPAELTCDNLDNCADWSDERAGTCGLATGSIIMITLMSLLCCGTCFAVGVYFCLDKKRDRRRNSRNNRDNSVSPNVEFNRNMSDFDPNCPPPYSTHFTTPMYTSPDEKPPAYNNLGYDTAFTPSSDPSIQNPPPADTPAQPTSTETSATSTAQDENSVMAAPTSTAEQGLDTTCAIDTANVENTYDTIAEAIGEETLENDTSDA